MTNLTKSMLDLALKDLEEKLKTAFNLKMDEADMNHSAKITNLNQEISDLKIENGNLKSKVEKLEKAPPVAATTPRFSNLFSKSKPAEFETKVLNAISAETKKKSSKDENIVIFGLTESSKSNKDEKNEEDRSKIEDIFQALNLHSVNIDKHYRIKGSKTTGSIDKPGILIVELKSKIEQQQVLQESRNLNNISEYKGKVYINADLTIAERSGLKMLLTERNRLNKIESDNNSPFRYVIRNDKLEKFKPKTLK
jgi:hypothetical protein